MKAPRNVESCAARDSVRARRGRRVDDGLVRILDAGEPGRSRVERRERGGSGGVRTGARQLGELLDQRDASLHLIRPLLLHFLRLGVFV